MPGQFHLTAAQAAEESAELQAAGIPAVLLFGIPDHKDDAASSAYEADGVVQTAIREIRRAAPEMVVVTDVCLCQYMSHGHCGVLRDGVVENDLSLELLAETALSHAAAGADVVAPSDMMDGRVAAIRSALDEDGFSEVSILAYSAKYASAFYGPFREAAEGAPKFGDRATHQQDPANALEALKEVELDLAEGADMVMVKPALSYLDVIRRVADTVLVPVAAYQVSGEFAMVEAAAANGWVDRDKAIMETLTAIRRAGASVILTYWATEVARRLR
jgi:porphobilinogen synthase